MLKVEGVSKNFGPKVAVQEVSFSVEPGEILGLLGPNGAGKTTTLRLITGYMPPSRGRITVSGIDVAANPLAVKRRLGYLPEQPPLYPELTVREYLAFVARVKGWRGAEANRRVDEAMARAGVEEVAGRLIGHLSRGYRQRVGLAQAFLGDPELLILDEPTVGLDPVQIAEVRQLIKDLAGKHTVVLSSHILPEVNQVCHRVVIMNQGRVLAQDTPANLAAALGGGQLRVKIKGPVSEVLSLLENLEGVRTVRTEDDGRQEQAGVREYVLELVPGRDVREALFFALAQRGWPLLEAHLHQLSLEEVFLQLVTEEEGHEGGGN
ncbi:MAG: ABC transporter ATP-binding protein [Moorellales bacterium]